MNSAILSAEKQKKNTTIIAVGAGKGGVGKSSMTVHLALIFSSLGHKVGILDADIYGPSMHIMLPKESAPGGEGAKLAPFVVKGLKVLSLAYFQRWQGTHVVRAPIANALLKQFVHEVEWGDIDFLFIDLPPGTGDIHITLMQTLSITASVVITTPQKVAVSDVEKTITMFQKMAIPLLGIVENMSFFVDSLTGEKYFPFGSGGGELLQKMFSIPLLGKVPMDPAISESLDRGGSIFEEGGSALTKKMLWEIGLEIAGKICDNSSHRKHFFEVHEVDETHFSCVMDGKPHLFPYAHVQRHCPCARCFDPRSRLSLRDPEEVDPHLSAGGIEAIGNYALRFRFTSGCDQGIYTWDFLKKLSLSL